LEFRTKQVALRLDQHTLIVGQSGSGKTTTLLTLLDQWQKDNVTTIVLDPTGEYTVAPNTTVYRLGDDCMLNATDFSADELLKFFQLDYDELLMQLVEQAMTSLRIQKNIFNATGIFRKVGLSREKFDQLEEKLGVWAQDYELALLPRQIIEECILPEVGSAANYNLVGQKYNTRKINKYWSQLLLLENRLHQSNIMKVLTKSNQSTVITELYFILNLFLAHKSQHRTLVLDLSLLIDFEKIQSQIISLILKKMLRIQISLKTKKPIKVIIDEVHRYVMQQEIEHSGLFEVLHEGRKYDINLIAATQSPMDTPTALLSQFSKILCHRLSTTAEINAVTNYRNRKEIPKKIARLSIGELRVWQNDKLSQVFSIKRPIWERKQK
jgi:GTPase SAR1 family protein